MKESITTNVYMQQSGVYNNPYTEENKRRCRDVGDFKAPETAVKGTYIDKKCPFTGDLKLKNVYIRGVVTKMKQPRTIVIKKKYFFYVEKYKRYERRYKNVSVHLSPCFVGLVNVGSIVSCVLTRPISKTKRYLVVGVEKKIEPEKKIKVLAEL